MTFKSFEDIDAWKRSHRLAIDIYSLTSEGAISKDWGLRDQLRRSAISVSSNIAEGFERNSTAEFRRFVLIAKGSCGELRSQLRVVNGLKLVTSSRIASMIQECAEISSMLQSLVHYLTNYKKSQN